MTEINSAKTVVLAYWQTMNTNDFYAATNHFSDDFQCIWPQSNEVILGKENFALINTQYPQNGKWEFKINQILVDGDQVVTDVSVTDGVVQARAITFHTVRNNLISKQVEYWPDNYSAPEWRKAWVKPADCAR